MCTQQGHYSLKRKAGQARQEDLLPARKKSSNLDAGTSLRFLHTHGTGFPFPPPLTSSTPALCLLL